MTDLKLSRPKGKAAARLRPLGLACSLALLMAAPIEASAARGPGEISDVADQVVDAVVNISATTTEQVRSFRTPGDSQNTPFDDLSILGGILGALRCRQAQPHMRLDIILRAQAVGVHESEVELRQGQALVGGEAKPFDGVGIVLRSAFAIPRHDAKIELSQGVALVGGEMIPF